MSLFRELTDDELKKLAKDLLTGYIFSDLHLKIEDRLDQVGTVFLVIGLGGLIKVDIEEIKNIGMIYEYLSEAGPLAANNMPMFFSAKFLTREQTEKLIEYVRKIEEAYNSI